MRKEVLNFIYKHVFAFKSEEHLIVIWYGVECSILVLSDIFTVGFGRWTSLGSLGELIVMDDYVFQRWARVLIGLGELSVCVLVGRRVSSLSK